MRTAAGVAAGMLGVLAAAMAQEGGPPPVKPTAEHRTLRAEVGVWEAEVRMYMGGPDAPPEVSKAVEINRMMPGGLWLLQEFRGEFAGQPFFGRGQFGYDPYKKKYVGTWIDTMSPTLMILEGTHDEPTDTSTMIGESVDPASGQPVKMKLVTVYKDDGTRTFTMYMTPPGGGGEMKAMETTYRKLDGEAAKAALKASQPKGKAKGRD
jgi:hypothetical protein